MSSMQWFTRSTPTVSCLSIANAIFNFVPTPSMLATSTGSRIPGKLARNNPPNPPIFPSTCGPCVCLTNAPMPRFNLFARSTSTPACAYAFSRSYVVGQPLRLPIRFGRRSACPTIHLRSVNSVGCASWSASALARCSRRSMMNLSSAGSTGRG